MLCFILRDLWKADNFRISYIALSKYARKLYIYFTSAGQMHTITPTPTCQLFHYFLLSSDSLIEALNKHVQTRNNPPVVSHFSLNACSVLNRDYLSGRSWLSSPFGLAVFRASATCLHRHSGGPLGAMLLQLNPLMPLIAHRSVCVCLSGYAYCRTHMRMDNTVEVQGMDYASHPTKSGR